MKFGSEEIRIRESLLSALHTLSDDLHAELNGSPSISPGQSEIGVAHHRVKVGWKKALPSRDANTFLHQPLLLLTLTQSQFSKEFIHLCSMIRTGISLLRSR